jgi:small subunit ribosomal protein S2
MPVATRRELLEAGVHFGHQTRRWNPKMHRFIFGERSGIYIIDLEKTLTGLTRTYEFLVDVGRRNGVAMFVGTKKQAQETVAEQASRVGMPFVNTRWLGGMLTNFQTIHSRLKRMKELREMERSGAFEFLPKKEVLKLRHEKEKLDRNLSGIQDMERLPDAVFVIDTKREHIAVKEARKLGIPVIAIVDTNCDPDEVDFVIPGNDDAIRSCSLIAKVLADALQEGQYLAYQGMAGRTFEPEFEQEPASTVAGPVGDAARRGVQLSEEEAAFFAPSLTETAEATEAPDEAIQAEPQEPSATAVEPAPEPEEESPSVVESAPEPEEDSPSVEETVPEPEEDSPSVE